MNSGFANVLKCQLAITFSPLDERKGRLVLEAVRVA